jgi:hypothetical protein
MFCRLEQGGDILELNARDWEVGDVSYGSSQFFDAHFNAII